VTTADVRAGTEHRLSVKVQAFIAAQVAIPLALLLHRLATGEVDWYGWGWQMYSVFR
jgi:hypothetical protein